MNPNQLIASITAISAAIAEGRSVEELGFLSAVFTQLGDTFATLAVQKAICDKKNL